MVKESKEWMERIKPEAIIRLIIFLMYSLVSRGIRMAANTEREIRVVDLLLRASALPSGLKMRDPIIANEKRIRGSD